MYLKNVGSQSYSYQCRKDYCSINKRACDSTSFNLTSFNVELCREDFSKKNFFQNLFSSIM